MQEQNPYAPPESNLEVSIVASSNKKTIEEALASDYDFSIGEILSNSWAATKGFKMHSFLAMLIIGVIGFIFGLMEGFLPEAIGYGISIISNGLISVITVGLYILALKHLRGESIDFSKDFFSFSPLLVPLLLAYYASTFLTLVGILLLVIPGIYLAVAYSLTLWIIVDNPNTGFWTAMEASRKLISKKWFKVFGLYIVMLIIVALSMIPLFIGLIWTVPMSVLAMGILYRTIFGEIK